MISGDATQTGTEPSRAEMVAPLLPATAEPPEPARRINFLKALLLYWLMPKRLGPHLAVDTWKRALAAHVLAVVVAGGILAAGALLEQAGSYRGLRHMRVAAAETVVMMATGFSQVGLSWLPIVLVVLAVPVVQLALFVVAVIAMPWCAGGDRAASVLKRSLKNVYWATTILVPLSIPTALLVVFDREMERWFGRVNDMVAVAMIILVPLLAGGWVLRLLIVGASRYVGEPDGAAFAPREPRCDDCGYLIVNLPCDARCPECGLEIRESLPGGRRRPTAWQQHALGLRGIVDLVRTQGQVLRSVAFFRRIPVHQGLPAARHFWWATFALMLITLLGALKLISLLLSQRVFSYVLGPLAVGVAAVPLVAQTAIMAAGCLWGQFRHGIRDYRVSAVTCYYATPLMWPFMILAFAYITFMASPLFLEMLEALEQLVRTRSLILVAAVIVVPVVILLIPIWFWWRRLMLALAAARYANV